MQKFDLENLISRYKISNQSSVYFLMDLSWHMYRSYYTFKNLSVNIDGDNIPTGHVFGTLRTIVDLKKKDKNYIIILCKDGHPDFRKKQEAEYKSNRVKLDYNIYDNLNIIEGLSHFIPGVYSVYGRSVEADDLLYSLSRSIIKSCSSAFCYIYSGDDDLLQAISERVKVIRKFSRKKDFPIIDEDYMKKNKSMIRKFRYCSPESLVLYRAIVGDKSDNLPGIYRFPRKLATFIAEHCESPDDILNLELPEESSLSESYLQKAKDNIDLIKKNYKLMNLKELDKDDYLLYKLENSKSSILQVISKYKLKSFRRSLIQLGYLS